MLVCNVYINHRFGDSRVHHQGGYELVPVVDPPRLGGVPGVLAHVVQPGDQFCVARVQCLKVLESQRTVSGNGL